MMNSFDVKLMHPRDQIVLIINRIYHKGMTTTSGGNVSIIDDQGDIWITPSGIDKGTLQAADINCIRKDGTITGNHQPSCEFPIHRAIYQERPDLKAIIHAHPPALVSFSIVHGIPDTNIVPQAKHICGPIGYAVYDVPGSEELGDKIAKVFSNGLNAVIMENHATVVGGVDLRDCYQRFETLEFCARTIIYGKTIGNVNYLSDEQIDRFQAQIPALQPEMIHVSHSSDEREKREEIVRIVRRACDQGLMISTYGTVSVRVSGDDFLITPTNVLRWDITLDDIVQIKAGQREPGKLPSRTVWLHQEIYKRNPHINSIIFTQSPYLMAFSVTGEKFNVRTIPESWIFLQDVPNVPFGSQFFGEETILKLISKNIPAIIIQNEAILVTGDKLLQTFDRLEVAEFSAKSLLMSIPLGAVKPIEDQEIENLRAKFLNE
jgi:L-fuculose-phosphate aldolase